MKENKDHFKDVTLLITHYNRSKSLEILLDHFDKIDVSFGEIVVSDDHSKDEHVQYIKKLQEKYGFKFITTPQNGGLGNNINKGQDAVTGDFILYVQEDFFPLPLFNQVFKNGLNIIKEDQSIDSVRFYSYLDYPDKKPYKDNFSELVFKPFSSNLDRFPLYSDHPHVKRASFPQKFGRYAEGKNPEKTEFDMMISFLQHKGRGLLYNDYKSVFDQVNTSSEPSTMNDNRNKKPWRNSENFFVRQARHLYRHAIFNYSLYFKKY